jgi:alpha-glucosidase (family GH31 glycosyl hydrolase)
MLLVFSTVPIHITHGQKLRQYMMHTMVSHKNQSKLLRGVFVEDYNQQSHWTFTVNSQNYPNLAAEVDNIHSRNQKILFGASVALAPDTSYPAYQNAKNGKCLI